MSGARGDGIGGDPTQRLAPIRGPVASRVRALTAAAASAGARTRLPTGGCQAAVCPSSVALVTGGSRGIGAATAVALAAAGWDVAITYRERADAADDVVAACSAAGRRAHRRPRRSRRRRRRRAAVRRRRRRARPPRPARQQRRDRLAGRHRRLVLRRAARAVLRLNVDRRLPRRRRRRPADVDRPGGRGGVIVNVSSRAAVLGGAGRVRRLRGEQGGGRRDDGRPGRRGRRGRASASSACARPDRDRDPRARAGSTGSARRRRSGGPGPRPRSPRRSSGWPRRRPPTSPARRSTSAAGADHDRRQQRERHDVHGPRSMRQWAKIWP